MKSLKDEIIGLLFFGLFFYLFIFFEIILVKHSSSSVTIYGWRASSQHCRLLYLGSRLTLLTMVHQDTISVVESTLRKVITHLNCY